MSFEEKLLRTIESSFICCAHKHFDNTGIIKINDLLFFIRNRFYTCIEPSTISNVNIFINVKAPFENIITTPHFSDPSTHLSELSRSSLVQIFPDGTFNYVIDSNFTELDVNAFSERGIIYSRKIDTYSSKESFFINKEICNLEPLDVDSSYFAPPCFTDLTDALNHYKQNVARVSRCPFLMALWIDGNHRTILKAKPEADMRRSLENYLNNKLEGTDVKPEQNTSETNPVDIKVTWLNSNREALIEIKWLGKSETTDYYYECRARDGALQLAEYLENNRQRSPNKQSKGYLVVFDARRKDVIPPSRDSLFHYKEKEITYSQESSRNDFYAFRFFMEPICV